jgi:hypothetical protein
MQNLFFFSILRRASAWVVCCFPFSARHCGRRRVHRQKKKVVEEGRVDIHYGLRC